jgi:glutamyl-tRNA reductase
MDDRLRVPSAERHKTTRDVAPSSEPTRPAMPRQRELHDRLVVLFAGRDVSTSQREALLVPLDRIRSSLEESCLLHTCHRVELIGTLAPGSTVTSAPQAVQVSRGVDAVAHVFSVVAGLDSAVVAEEQLLGQVREAFAAALASGRTGPIVNELLRRAIRIGKRSRSMAQPASVQSLAAAAVSSAIGHLRKDGVKRGRALLLGTGEVAREAGARLASNGFEITVASADPARARRLADALGGDPHPSAGAAALTHGPWTVVVAATRISEPILGVDHAAALHGAFVIDLCAPPGVSPELRRQLGSRIIDLDRMAMADTPQPLSPAAMRRVKQMINLERDDFVQWLEERASGDAIGALHRRAEAVRGRHVDRLRRRGILEEKQLAAVDHMARAMVAELLHTPTIHLRGGGERADLVRKLLGLDA